MGVVVRRIVAGPGWRPCSGCGGIFDNRQLYRQPPTNQKSRKAFCQSCITRHCQLHGIHIERFDVHPIYVEGPVSRETQLDLFDAETDQVDTPSPSHK